MKGLLIKDLYLIFQRKTVLMYLICCMLMGFSMGVTFIVSYLAIIMCISGVGTISYDEHDNGYPFLFSLPIDRKTYVREKFVLCLSLTFAGVFLGALIMMLASFIGLDDLVMSDIPLYLLPICAGLLVICSTMITIEICFGAEKGRIVMMMIYGAAIFIAVLLGKTGLLNVSSIAYFISIIPGWVLITGVALFIILFVYVTYLLCIRKMEKKEF